MAFGIDGRKATSTKVQVFLGRFKLQNKSEGSTDTPFLFPGFCDDSLVDFLKPVIMPGFELDVQTSFDLQKITALWAQPCSQCALDLGGNLV